MNELKSQDSLATPSPIGFYFLGSDRLPYNPTESPESPRTYFVNEKLKFRLALPVQNVVTGNLSLILEIGSSTKSIPYSKASSTDEYIEFNYLVSGSDAGEMYVDDIGSFDDLVAYLDNGNGWRIGSGWIKLSGVLPFRDIAGGGVFQTSQLVVLGPQVMINGAEESGSVRASTLLLKRSSVPGKEPLESDLLSGELAINTNDGKLFAKLADGNVRHLNSIEPQVFSVEKITLSSSQNDLDVGNKAVVRVDATSPDLTISGILAGSDGQILMMYNTGEPFSLLNNSEESEEGNRIIIFGGEDFVLDTDSGITLLYDSTSGAWRLF